MVMDRHKFHSLSLDSWPYHNFLLAKILSSCASCWRPTKHIISDYQLKIRGNIFQNDHFCLPFTKTFNGRRHPLARLSSWFAIVAGCCTSTNLPNKSTQQNRQRMNESNDELQKTHVAFGSTWLLAAVQLRAMALMFNVWQQWICCVEPKLFVIIVVILRFGKDRGRTKFFFRLNDKDDTDLYSRAEADCKCGPYKLNEHCHFFKLFIQSIYSWHVDQMWMKICNQ